MTAFGSIFSPFSPAGTVDQSRLALAISNLPSFARQYRDKREAVGKLADRLGLSHPKVSEAMDGLAAMRHHIETLNAWAIDAYRNAVAVGKVREPNPPVFVAEGEGLSGWSIVVIALVVAVALVCVIAAAPLILGASLAAYGTALVWAAGIGAAGATVVAVLASVGAAVGEASSALGPAGAAGLSLGVLVLIGVAGYLWFQRKGR